MSAEIDNSVCCSRLPEFVHNSDLRQHKLVCIVSDSRFICLTIVVSPFSLHLQDLGDFCQAMQKNGLRVSSQKTQTVNFCNWTLHNGGIDPWRFVPKHPFL